VEFQSPETQRDTEVYRVELSNATVLELSIVPHISGGSGSGLTQELCSYPKSLHPRKKDACRDNCLRFSVLHSGS